MGIKKCLQYPSKVLLKLDKYGIIRLKDDNYLKMMYRSIFFKKLDLENPKTFNEKLQWLKVYDRKDIYTTMVDKYEAKKYVASIIGDEYIIPTIGVYDSFNEIDFDKLPEKFVIKCTHDSGGLVIVKDKSKMDYNSVKKKIDECLNRNYYYLYREWPYKNVKPRIIVEELMEDKNCSSLTDYKFFCFNGEPKLMYMAVGLDDHKTASMSFYDMNFKLTDCKRKDYKYIDYIPKKPKEFDQMINFSKLLSKDIPHLRVDWYEIDGKLYFGELTFTTNGGFIPFESEKWNYKMGEWIELPKKEDYNEE